MENLIAILTKKSGTYTSTTRPTLMKRVELWARTISKKQLHLA